MISSSDILHGKVLIVDDQEASVLLLERMLRGAGYVSITSTMDAECGAISVNIGSCHWRCAPVSEWRVIRTQSKSSAFTRYNRETPWPFASGTRLVWGRRL